MLVQLY